MLVKIEVQKNLTKRQKEEKWAPRVTIRITPENVFARIRCEIRWFFNTRIFYAGLADFGMAYEVRILGIGVYWKPLKRFERLADETDDEYRKRRKIRL